MKKNLFWGLIVLFAMVITSCDKKYQGIEKQLINLSGTVYFTNTSQTTDGKIIMDLYFYNKNKAKIYVIRPDYLVDSAKYLGDNFFLAYKKGKITIYDSSGGKIFKEEYENAKYQNGLFILGLSDGKFHAGLKDKELTGDDSYYAGGFYDELIFGRHGEFFYRSENGWGAFKGARQLIPAGCSEVVVVAEKDGPDVYYLYKKDKKWAVNKANGDKLFSLTEQKATKLMNFGAKNFPDKRWKENDAIRGTTIDKIKKFK